MAKNTGLGQWVIGVRDMDLYKGKGPDKTGQVGQGQITKGL